MKHIYPNSDLIKINRFEHSLNLNTKSTDFFIKTSPLGGGNRNMFIETQTMDKFQNRNQFTTHEISD